jgi:hypothetical protein
MPYYHFEEISTPLKLIGVRLYRDDQKRIWFKLRGRPRQLLNKKLSVKGQARRHRD